MEIIKDLPKQYKKMVEWWGYNEKVRIYESETSGLFGSKTYYHNTNNPTSGYKTEYWAIKNREDMLSFQPAQRVFRREFWQLCDKYFPS
jgi:hypothetical protein